MCRTSFIRKRKSQDLTVCHRGEDLLELCIEANLSISNGKTFGDMLGKYTSFQYNGNRVVDYCIVSDDIIESVLFLLMYIIIYHTYLTMLNFRSNLQHNFLTICHQ